MPTEKKSLKRREFLAGAGIAALAASPLAAGAQTPLQIVDFHNHYVGPAFPSRAGGAAPPAQQAYWQAVNRNLASADALLSSIGGAGIAARVINTPLEFIRDADGGVPADATQRINDQIADLVSRNPDRLLGLATVDAYGGDAAARETTRAVRELNLRGLFVECAKGDLFLDAPQARPTLAAAAALGVPVFAHPIIDAELRQRLGRYGRLGTVLNRATINSAALFALLESGTFDELPKLRVVVTTLAIGGLLIAGGFGDGAGLRRDAPELTRKHVYIDTMGLNPVLIRSAVDMIGPDHVLVGTDWPIFTEASVPQRLQSALIACGLSAPEQQMIASGNTLRLLGAT